MKSHFKLIFGGFILTIGVVSLVAILVPHKKVDKPVVINSPRDIIDQPQQKTAQDQANLSEQNPQDQPSLPDESTSNPELDDIVSPLNYRLDEIQIHNTKDDCWMVVEKSIYDITTIIDQNNVADICGKQLDKTQLASLAPNINISIINSLGNLAD